MHLTNFLLHFAFSLPPYGQSNSLIHRPSQRSHLAFWPQVYKRVAGEGYKLKLAASRAVMTEVIKKFPSLPFTLRSLEAKNAR